MFFSISKITADDRFINHYKANSFYISLDNGWSKFDTENGRVFFKGYSDEHISLENCVSEKLIDPTPSNSGNFCVIIVNNNQLTITHDINRGFPLKEYSDGKITNLLDSDVSVKEHIWSDCYITVNDDKLTKHYFDSAMTDIVDVSETECVDNIVNLLNNKAKNLKNFDNVNVFLSGGVDTTLVYSLIKKHLDNNQYNIVASEHLEFTPFFLKNFSTFTTLPEMWGYKQFHHWKKPTLYATGGMGDEIFMRGPTTVALWAAWHNIDLIKEFENIDYSYHKKYFLKEKNRKAISQQWKNRKQIQNKLKTKAELHTEIRNNVLNDHQHWHLENTISWTPLKDVRILNTMLGLPIGVLLEQIIHGSIDKKIISRIYPGLEEIVCTHKNHNQYNKLLLHNDFVKVLK